MNWASTKIATRVDTGEAIEGMIAQCIDCAGVVFCYFRAHGWSHGHLQCVQCGRIECPFGPTCAANRSLQILNEDGP